MAKSYPDQLVQDDITFQKSTTEMYLEFQPQLSRLDIDKFLSEQAELIRWKNKPKDRKSLLHKHFNEASQHGKWVEFEPRRKESIDKVANKIESKDGVRFAEPIYIRKDLNIPNGFALDDQIIIRFDRKTMQSALKKLIGELGLEKVNGPEGELGTGLMLLRLKDAKNQNIFELTKKLDASPLIESARINMIQLHQSISVIPNDSYFANQWNLRNTGQVMPDGAVASFGSDINVEPAWNISKGSPLVVIAVLDTGCDLNHQDLFPHFVQPERWFNAHTGLNDPDDDIGHGTCCAGIAASLTNSLSPQGVAGVGWNCRIMPVRMVWNNGYSTSEAAITSALNHALNNNASIISMSWRWNGAQTNINMRLQDCYNAGIVLVAASGNYAPSLPDIISYPANNANVIAVGATNENDERCTNTDWLPNTGSQYGPELSVVAPGVHTWSTDISGVGLGYNSAYGGGDVAGNFYEDFGGTSGATPHVAGLAGLMMAYNPTLTPAEVRNIIENTADDMVGDAAEDVAGWDKYMGHGRINAHAALLEVQTNHPYTPADVFIRDSLSDTGIEPYIGSPLCYSPDIIIRKTPVANPQADFANMSVDPGSDNVEIGNDNYIYIRVHNKGTTTTDIHARIYFAPLNTSCGPDLWEYIGQIDFYDIAAGAHAISDALVWENVPDPSSAGHFCLISSIAGTKDDHPDPAGITNATQYMQFIRDNNNICYRNVVFEDVLADSTLSINFFVPGFAGADTKFDLRVERDDLDVRANVDIRLPHSMFKETRAHLAAVVERTENQYAGTRTFRFKGEKQTAIKDLVVKRGIRIPARLYVDMPKDAIPGEYRLSVQQVYKDEVIGEFHVRGRVVDPAKVKFVAVRGDRLVHRADCKCIKESDKQRLVPFDSLQTAKSAGYDMALDCLDQPFTAKDVSSRLARKVLNVVNKIQLAEDFEDLLKKPLDSDYFTRRYKKNMALQQRAKLVEDVAQNILDARDELGRFTKLDQLEEIKGVGTDEFMDIVNLIKWP